MTDVQAFVSMLLRMEKVRFHYHFDDREEIWSVAVEPPYPSRFGNIYTNFIFDKEGKLDAIYPCEREEQ